MPTYATPKPITVDIDLYVGNLTITAADRTDTVVTVNPTNTDDESDMEAAAKTKVDFSSDTLVIKGMKLRDYFSWSKKSRSIDVAVVVPTGSSVSGSASLANLTTTGQLDACEYKAGIGDFFVARAGSVKLRTVGEIVVDEADGNVQLSCGTGKLRLGRVSGTVEAKNSNGACVIGQVDGDAKVRASNGDISIDRAEANVDAVTANGNVRLGRVHHGSVALKTGMGELDIGVADGTAAWVDAHTGYGKVQNLLSGSGEPGPDEPVAKIQARTSYGDIVVRRAQTHERQ